MLFFGFTDDIIKRRMLLMMISRILCSIVLLIMFVSTTQSMAGFLDIFDIDNFTIFKHSSKIIINAKQRRLTYISESGKKTSYPIAVPKHGKEWSGTTYVTGKYIKPDWSPPEDVAADHPSLPQIIPGGSSRNPMGARAITLAKDNVAIHGTTVKMRQSIGSAASYGCIRMRNEDVIDLYKRVQIGTPVVMIR